MAGSAWPTPRSIGAALGITLGVALALAVFFGAFPSGSLWTPFEPGDCAEYCEASTRCGGFESRGSIQQPLNSWSSLAFVFVGVLALARPLHAGRVLFFVSCTVLGIGSFLFHASVTREMQWLDS